MRSTLSTYLPSLKDYNFKFFKEDLLAGITVAIVALPLALAFGVTSGAGAAAGLFTAIIAGILAAAFGGSNFQISGPTGAMTVVLLPIIARYGVEALAFVGLLAGLFLIVFAFAGIGRYVNYIPWPVIAGFTNGIAVIIFLQQLPGFLGVAKGEGEGILIVSWHTLENFLLKPDFKPILLSLLTIAVMLVWMRFKRLKAIPASMAALTIVSLISLLPGLNDVPRIGTIPNSLPSPVLPVIARQHLTEWVRAGLAIAVLAA
ncbi:MAG: SulP family inorganic anion transporter, partial [Trueperaceae bacterium]|nr:SulP family inorganic anion transporter [Trueperaceae bacterium]